MIATFEELRALPVSEKLDLIGNLWDSINNENAEMSLTDDQVRGLERRSSELDADPSMGIPWGEAKRRLLERFMKRVVLSPRRALRSAFLVQLFLFIGLANSQAFAADFVPAAPMNNARINHTATLLPNGKVLVAGGFQFRNLGVESLKSAELFDPAGDTWGAAGDLGSFRDLHTATLLPTGQVLVAGGRFIVVTSNGNVVEQAQASSELYDPANNTWSATKSLSTARYGHTATMLPCGKVLVAGGLGNGNPLNSAELYDAATQTWSSAGSLTQARAHHTTTLLPSGKVLVTGGGDHFNTVVLSSSELYDPASNTWIATGPLKSARSQHTATLLPSGGVLVAGGIKGTGSDDFLNSAELYDPSNNTWKSTGSLIAGRSFQSVALLPKGQVLIAGGQGVGASASGRGILSSAELYDPVNKTWKAAGSLGTARASHTATLLPNGQVLVAGGDSNANIFGLSSAELYNFGSVGTGTTSIVSGPTATPNPAAVSQSLAFSVSATNTKKDPLGYVWQFGDGTTGDAAHVSHPYATAGTFTATVTVIGGRSPIVASTQVFVSDTVQLNIAKTTIRLNFAKSGTDSITFSGTVPITEGFDPNGSALKVNIGGVSQSFKLGSTGRATSGLGSVKISLKIKRHGVLGEQAVKYSVTLKNGSFASTLNALGLTDADTTGVTVTVPFTINFNNAVYAKTQFMSYTVTKGKIGLAR